MPYIYHDIYIQVSMVCGLRCPRRQDLQGVGVVADQQQHRITHRSQQITGVIVRISPIRCLRLLLCI